MLFNVVEYASSRRERYIGLIIGMVLCLFGSMIRFQCFALCVALTGGIGVYRFVCILKNKSDQWKKKIGIYLLTFGMVGMLCTGLYVFDRMYYAKDEEWVEYLEYNELRSELWDMGFPDYVENQELYEELGISTQDMTYYGKWNIDTDLLSTETLRKLVAAKERKVFSIETIKVNAP